MQRSPLRRGYLAESRSAATLRTRSLQYIGTAEGIEIPALRAGMTERVDVARVLLRGDRLRN